MITSTTSWGTLLPTPSAAGYCGISKPQGWTWPCARNKNCEQELRTALTASLPPTVQRRIRLVRLVRRVFIAIGRVHAYGNGEIMHYQGTHLVDSRNPMTKATQVYLVHLVAEP